MNKLRYQADRERGIGDDAPAKVPTMAQAVSDEQANDFYEEQRKWRDGIDTKTRDERKQLERNEALACAWIEEAPAENGGSSSASGRLPPSV